MYMCAYRRKHIENCVRICVPRMYLRGYAQVFTCLSVKRVCVRMRSTGMPEFVYKFIYVHEFVGLFVDYMSLAMYCFYVPMCVGGGTAGVLVRLCYACVCLCRRIHL